jgi:TonB family protein
LKFLRTHRYIGSMPKLLGSFATVLLCAAPAAVRCQLPNLPSPMQTAPAAAKPSLALPPASYDRPTGPVPDPKKGWVCDAPPTAVFMDALDTHPEKKGEVMSYMRLVHTQLYDTWISSLPRSANNSWAKGRLVKVRFAIMPDGSFSPPEVTVSSGQSDYDRAAVNAILLRGMFTPPPRGPWKSLAICMTFASHIDPPDDSQDWMKNAK